MSLATRFTTSLIGAASAMCLLLFPVLLIQGRKVRRDTVLLPEGAGDRRGRFGSDDASALNLLVLGDSVGASVGAATQTNGLAGATAKAIEARAVGAVEWQVVARSGAIAANLVQQLSNHDAASGVDIVLVSIGVNDTIKWTWATKWLQQLEQFEQAFVRQHGDVPIVYLGLPPLHQFPALPFPLNLILGLRSTYLDRRLRQWSLEAPYRVCVALEASDDSLSFAADGFHPGEPAYGLIGNEVARIAALQCPEFLTHTSSS